MAGKGYVDLELWQYAESVSKEAKRNVGASKNGRRIESTGKLRASIRYVVTRDNEVKFFMEDYGVYVDSGRDGTKQKWRTKKGLLGKSNTPAFPNVGAIKQWINDKPLRPRDLKTGQFAPKNKKTLDSMSFLIGRKILEKGIKPTYFFSDALRKYNKNFGDKVVDALINDFQAKIDSL